MYRLTGKALPSAGGCKLVAEMVLSDLGEGEKRLEAVYISGSGSFTVSAAGEDGLSSSASAKAGEWTRFPIAVRGENISLTVSFSQTAACIDGIGLRVRREDRI